MATKLTGALSITAADLTANTSTQEHDLGALAFTSDGRAYRYCKAGATALVPGKVQQSPAEDTGVQNLAGAAAAIGATSVTTTTTVTVTANEYAGGWLVVTVTPGQGYQYKIKSHPAASAAVVTLTLEDPIVVALTTDSRYDLVHNAFNGVIVSPTTQSSSYAGVAVTAITAAYFGWIQVGGPAVVLAEGALTVGSNLGVGTVVAGAMKTGVAAAATVAVAMSGINDTQYGPVTLILH